MRFHNSNSKLR